MIDQVFLLSESNTILNCAPTQLQKILQNLAFISMPINLCKIFEIPYRFLSVRITVLPSYPILPFCNAFWPQITTPENSVPFNGITSTQCQKGFFLLISSSLMLDPLNHCYFTLLCYVASILTIKAKPVIGVHIHKCSSL